MNKPLKTLKIGEDGDIYEIYDETARNDIAIIQNDLENYYDKEEVESLIPTTMNGEAIEYSHSTLSSVTNVQEALNNLIDKVYYINPSCTLSATPTGGSYEIGNTIDSITFTWTVNKTITSQSLTDCTIELDDRSATYSTSLSSAKTFTLIVGDGQNTATSKQSYSFLPKIYYGAAEIPEQYDDTFVLGLSNNSLKSSKSGTYNIDIGAGKYGFIIMPKSYANAEKIVAKVGGFDTEIPRVATISHTNESGYTQDYNIFKTTNANLGSISAIIS